MLAEGAANRRSPVHTLVVASVTTEGSPSQRVMVLREADRASSRLRFHSDARAPKTLQLHDKAAHILAYEPAAAIQLRIEGMGRVETEGPRVDAVWAEATRFARRCYLAVDAPGRLRQEPGSGLPPEVEGRQPEEDELIPARANFALLLVDVTAIDWLHLANSGHRRCRFERDGDGWSARWLQP